MTLPKLFALLTFFLFGTLAVTAFFKESAISNSSSPPVQGPLEVELDQEIHPITPLTPSPTTLSSIPLQRPQPPSPIDLPEANRIEELFNTNGPKLPIVETITYKSHVPWQKERQAWLADYATHYATSRHFIARSLNGQPDYLKQQLAEGDRFNVFRKDKNFEFYLVVDTSRCHLWFYYIDLETKQKVLLKTYPVCLGRMDPSIPSGLLTPLGKYTLGHRIATYKPKTMGHYRGKKTEMITIFGTRWIPFDKEIGSCTAPAKGFGLHGTPWIHTTKNELVDSAAGIGKYESDGCIRLATPDIEELFAIIITKPTTIEIVRDFTESSLARERYAP